MPVRKKLILPTPAEIAGLKHKEEWALLVFERNPDAHPHFDVIKAFKRRSLGERMGTWTSEDSRRLQEVQAGVRAGGKKRAAMERMLAAIYAMRDRQAACTNWDDWVRLYLTTTRADITYTNAMKMVTRPDLGKLPSLDRLQELMVETGLMTTAALRKKREERAAIVAHRVGGSPGTLRPLPPKATAQREWLIEFQKKGGVFVEAAGAYRKQGMAKRLGAFPEAAALGWWGEAWKAQRAQRKAEARARRPTRKKSARKPQDFGAAHLGQALRSGGGQVPARAPMPGQLRALMETRQAPPALRAFVEQDCCFADSVTIGPVVLLSAKDQLLENTEEFNDVCFEEGLFVIGAGSNGDPIVVDVRSNTVGFISHDKLWDNDPIPDPRALVRDTGLSVGHFFLAAAQHSDTFPCDSYAAAQIKGDFAKRFPIQVVTASTVASRRR